MTPRRPAAIAPRRRSARIAHRRCRLGGLPLLFLYGRTRQRRSPTWARTSIRIDVEYGLYRDNSSPRRSRASGSTLRRARRPGVAAGGATCSFAHGVDAAPTGGATARSAAVRGLVRHLAAAQPGLRRRRCARIRPPPDVRLRSLRQRRRAARRRTARQDQEHLRGGRGSRTSDLEQAAALRAGECRLCRCDGIRGCPPAARALADAGSAYGAGSSRRPGSAVSTSTTSSRSPSGRSCSSRSSGQMMEFAKDPLHRELMAWVERA